MFVIFVYGSVDFEFDFGLRFADFELSIIFGSLLEFVDFGINFALRSLDLGLCFESDIVSSSMGFQYLTAFGLSVYFCKCFAHNYFGHSFEIVNVVSLDLGLLVYLRTCYNNFICGLLDPSSFYCCFHS